MTDADETKAGLAQLAGMAAADKEAAERAAAMVEAQAGHAPYEVLGMDGGNVILYSRERKSIVGIPAERVNAAALFLRVAPREVLAAHIPGGGDMSERQLAAAVRDDIAAQIGSRIYNPAKVRGAGIWNDAEGVIYSTGRDCYLLRDGEGVPRPVYPMRPDGTLYAAKVNKEGIPAPAAQPLTPAEGKAIYASLAARAWMEPYAADMVAGWLVCSLLAGLTPVRPHLWINGERGSGKSELRRFLQALYGAACHTPAGAESTKAGTRNLADSTALPVLFDESETDGRDRKAERMRDLLSMARLSFDGDQCSPRAAQGGGVEMANLRSGFMFISIRDFLETAQDFSRFHLLHINHISPAELAHLRQQQAEGNALALSPGTPSRLLTLAMTQARHVLSNAETIAARLEGAGIESRRALMDGLLLAARYALTDGGKASAAYLGYCDTMAAAAEETAQADSRPAWASLLDTILSHPCLLVPLKMNVKQAGQAAFWGASPETSAAATSALESLGIYPRQVDGRRKDGRAGQWHVVIKHGSDAFAPVLAHSPWKGGHGIAQSVKGAPHAEIRTCRAKGLPTSHLLIYEAAFCDDVDEEESDSPA